MNLIYSNSTSTISGVGQPIANGTYNSAVSSIGLLSNISTKDQVFNNVMDSTVYECCKHSNIKVLDTPEKYLRFNFAEIECGKNYFGIKVKPEIKFLHCEEDCVDIVLILAPGIDKDSVSVADRFENSTQDMYLDVIGENIKLYTCVQFAKSIFVDAKKYDRYDYEVSDGIVMIHLFEIKHERPNFKRYENKGDD